MPIKKTCIHFRFALDVCTRATILKPVMIIESFKMFANIPLSAIQHHLRKQDIIIKYILQNLSLDNAEYWMIEFLISFDAIRSKISPNEWSITKILLV